MTTGCNVILFNTIGEEKAILYHYCDGDPDTMMPKLQELFSKTGRLLKQRFDNPEKVAATLVAVSVDEAGVPEFVPCLRAHDNVECLYRVYLDKSGPTDVRVDEIDEV